MEESLRHQIKYAQDFELKGNAFQALSAYRSAIALMESGLPNDTTAIEHESRIFYCRQIVRTLEEEICCSQNTRVYAIKSKSNSDPNWNDFDALDELENLAPMTLAALRELPRPPATIIGSLALNPSFVPDVGHPSISEVEQTAYTLLSKAQDLDSRCSAAHARGALSPTDLQAVLSAYTQACTSFVALGTSASVSARRTTASALERLELLRNTGYGAAATAQEQRRLLAALPVAPGTTATGAAPVVASAGIVPSAASIASTSAGSAKFTGANAKSLAAQIRTVGDLAVGGGELSVSEKDVLRRSSVIGGRVYQPWLTDEEKREQFRYDNPFCDPDGVLPLSASQTRAGAKYLRPSQILASATAPKVEASGASNDMTLNPDAGIHAAKDGNLSMRTTRVVMVGPNAPHADAMSVTQEMVADCSFVCSLIIAALHEQKQKKRLITSIIFPQDIHGLPAINPSGKYLVKLFINGTDRKVIVDDRLPCLTSQRNGCARLLCSSAVKENRLELWVSIIEKAYLKVHGGYAFLGSNSGRDLYTLTGWIPEQIYLRKRTNIRMGCISEDDVDAPAPAGTNAALDHCQDSERAWVRLESAHAYGDALITVNTVELTPEQETTTGLVSTHAYAVLEVRQAGSLRMIKIKNPWAAKPWRGRFSSFDRKSWSRGLKRLLLTEGKRASAGTDEEEEAVFNKIFDQMEERGIFYIEFTDLLQYFKGIFVNWNPKLFKFRASFHEMWPGNLGPVDDRYFRGENPQYSLIVDTSEVRPGSSTPVWLLLSRHISGTHDDGSDDIFTAMHIYAHCGANRIYDSSDRPFIKGVYSNDVHVLVRIDVECTLPDPPGQTNASSKDKGAARSSGNEFTVLLSQDGRIDPANGTPRDLSYTISVFGAEVPYRFFSAPGPGKFKYEFSGKFTSSAEAGSGTPVTSGGPPGSGYYQHNPQWYLRTADAPPNARGVSDKWITVHLEAFYKKETQGNITIIELTSTRVGAAGGKLENLRINDMPPAAGTENVQWLDPERPGRLREGATSLLKMSSGPYRHGYCHLPRLKLRCSTDYIIVLSNYSPSQTGGYRMNCFAGEGVGGISQVRTVAQLPHF